MNSDRARASGANGTPIFEASTRGRTAFVEGSGRFISDTSGVPSQGAGTSTHGNWLTSPAPTWVYELVDSAGDTMKYGITKEPDAENRYNQSYYPKMSVMMWILGQYPDRATARSVECGLRMGYVAANSRLPPLEHFPEKWTPVFRKEMRQVSNLERFPATAHPVSWSA
jgi:hypothetical protein